MYAIIEDSGTQIKVSSGDIVDLDLREVAVGETVTLDRVLLVGDGDGAAKIGTPYLGGATVTAEVIGAALDRKLTIKKYKRRKGYRRTQGHRQAYIRVRVTGING